MSATAPTTAIGYTVGGPGGYAGHNGNFWAYDESETTPELRWPQSIYVYDQMRKQDSQVSSVLRAVTETILRTPWRIDPAGARPTVTKFVADDLGLPIVGRKPKPPPRMKDRFSWREHLREVLLMLPHGFSYFEQLYRVTPDGNAAHLRKLEYRPAKTIERIDVAPDGGLIAIQQYWTAMNRGPKPIPVNRLVAYIHAKEGGNWLGTSILRPAYKNWLIKDRLLRVQAQTIERNGMGIPLYKAQEGASDTDMAAGLAMAKAWRAGEAAGSAVPHDADLLLRGVEGDLPDAKPAIEYHDNQIARAVLAHFLNLGQQTGTGSYALGASFMDFFVMSLQTLAEQIRDTATSHIVEDLVDINFGEDEPAPRLVFDEIGSRQAATAQALKTLVDAGVIHPDQVLEESSRQQYGLPPADPATATPPPAAPTATPQAPTQTGDLSVAAAMGDPKGEAVAAADLDEEADDWEDAIDALIQALAELDGYVEAAWDSAKHPRNPKGPGGGRFRSMVDRLKDAITEHQKGNGGGHPFDGFDREQLRRVARARGIELKRGESRDEIAKKLLVHLQDSGAGRPKPTKNTAGWSAGAWKTESLQEFRSRREAEIFAESAEDIANGYYAEDYARNLARGIVRHELPDGTTVRFNGSYRIVNQGGTTHPDVAHAVESELDALIEANPLPNAVTVTFTGKKPATGSAAVTINEGRGILLNGEALTTRMFNPDWASFFMPAATGVPQVLYTVDHEYGHAIMFQMGHGPRAQQMYRSIGDAMSGYGHEDYKEAYAEAFAEWHASAGSTDNAAALVYAKEFGWQTQAL